MTSTLFEEWLRKLDNKMTLKKRKILLFLDNAPCHPDLELSSITLCFFPANTTSRLQPLDQGIIKTMKVHYRRRLLRHIISHMDEQSKAFEVSKTVNVLHAANWISQAWNEVSSQTIVNCFHKGGFTMNEIPESSDPEPPLRDFEELLQTADVHCGAGDFVAVDDSLDTFDTLDDDWEQQLLDRAKEIIHVVSDESDTEETETEPVPESNVLTHKQAIHSLDHLHSYAVHHSNAELIGLMLQAQTIVQKFYCEPKKSMKQASLDSYFTTGTAPQ